MEVANVLRSAPPLAQRSLPAVSMASAAPCPPVLPAPSPPLAQAPPVCVRNCLRPTPPKPADCGYPRQTGGSPVDVLGTIGVPILRIGSPANGPRLAAPQRPARAGRGVPA